MAVPPNYETNSIRPPRVILSSNVITFASVKSKAFLWHKHHKEMLTIQQIAEQCGVSRLTVWRAMKEHEIPMRAKSKTPKKLIRNPERRKRAL